MSRDINCSGRIKKYGVCLNDKCEHYKEIQEILHGDMTCECGKKLSPCAPPKKKSNKMPIFIGAAVVFIAIFIVCVLAFTGGSNEPEVAAVDTTRVDSSTVARTDTVTIVKTDTVKIEKTVEKVETPKVSKTIITATKTSKASSSEKGSVNFGYAKFTGAVSGGKPNGQGTMRFISSHVIDSRDPKGRVADAGDYVIGEWVSGKLVQGRWYGSDNNVKGSIIIGM